MVLFLRWLGTTDRGTVSEVVRWPTALLLGLLRVMLALAGSDLPAEVPQPFALEVVDRQTGRGVPLVELTTVDGQRFVTDSAGLIALAEPDLMDHAVYYHVHSHGYELAADGFGNRGRRVEVVPGGAVRIELDRINIAQRLYRMTGRGIYGHSQLLDRDPPPAPRRGAPQLVGCDSVMATEYRGKIHWFWGDTSRLAYPLGNFHITGATSPLPGDGQLDPAVGIPLDYFTDDADFVRPMAEMPGEGPTWLGGLAVLTDDEGNQRLLAHYVKIRNQLEVYRWGICQWDDQGQRFERVKTFADIPPAGHGQDHAFRHRDDDGAEYLYFANPLPAVRVKADIDAYVDPQRYERLTCLQQGTSLDNERLDRDGRGRLRYTWKRETPLVLPQDQARMLQQQAIEPREAIHLLHDPETGRAVVPHRGSVAWNEYRQRWIAIFSELGGETSVLGELWYAEADSPAGPWRYARKIVTHDRYTFYNPKHHPFLDQQGGRVIYFEGTYTHSFSGNPDRTPRYDYNQLMYRLDLDDPRLRLPLAVYDLSAGEHAWRLASGRPGQPVAFFALDADADAAVGMVRRQEEGQPVLRAIDDQADAEILFYAMPLDTDEPPAAAVPLYEYVHEPSGRRDYSIDRDCHRAGYRRGDPVCLVWSW